MSADILTPSLKDVMHDFEETKHASPGATVDALYPKCLLILQAESKDRSDEDINILYQWLQAQKIHLVHEHTPETIKELCRTMKYEKIEANNTVFSQGDQANKLYIILRGSVSLWVTNDHDDAEYPDPKQHTIQALQKLMDNAVNSPSIQKMQIEKTLSPLGTSHKQRASLRIDAAGASKAKEPLILNESPEQRRMRVQTNPSSPKVNKARRSLDQKSRPAEQIFVGIIRAGGPKTSFGELALISDSTRSATIRTDIQDCEFITIDKVDFDRVLKSRVHELLAEKVAKMKTFKLFSNMSDTHLNKISLHLETRNIGPKQLIAKQGNPATHLFFILKGQAELTKNEDQLPNNMEKRHSLKVRPAASYVSVGNLDSGSIFGAVEALSEPAKPYVNGLRSISECEVWQIERGDFMRRTKHDIIEEVLSDSKIQE